MTNQNLKFASFSQRLIAKLIDIIIIGLVAWPFSGLAIDKEQSVYTYENYTGIQLAFGYLIFYVLYYPICEAIGGTLGKRALSIKAVSIDTLKSVSIKQSYKRGFFLSWPLWTLVLVFIIGDFSGFLPEKSIMFLSIMFFLFAIVGPFAVLWTKTKQGWHDTWTKTYVIQE